MLRNYLKTALRNLWRHKSFSVINIVGLSIGMTACLLIFLFISFELSYDRFHDKGDRIYRLVTNIKTASETIQTGSTSYPMGINIKQDFPEVEASATIYGFGALLQHGDTRFQENDLRLADSTFFTTFSFPLVRGKAEEVLKAPDMIVLSERAAKKYFGNADPVGKEMLVNGDRRVMVSGIMKNMPENSHIKADIILPMSYISRDGNLNQQWGNFGWQTFLLLKPGADYKKLEAKLPAFLEARLPKDQRQMTYALLLQPFTEVYFDTDRGAFENGSMTNVYIFSVIAIFILIIACINFVNLTTARAAERAKEVGVRKVIGASRRELAVQFLGESMMICLVSFCLALFFSALLSPLFNTLCGKEVSSNIFQHPQYLLLLLGVALLIGLLAGVYPALILSHFKPVSVLKGRFVSGKSGIALRKSLVVVQFAVSIMLIAGTIIVYKQLYFMRHQELGFDKEQMVLLNYYRDGDVNKRLATLKQELAEVPGVASVTATMAGPGTGQWGAYTEVENPQGELQAANMDLFPVDFGFIEQLGIQMAAGRSFDVKYATDSTKAMILNETAARLLGYHKPEDVIGKKFAQWGREGQVVGVVKDFNYESLRDTVRVLCIRIDPANCSRFAVKLKGGNIKNTIAGLEKRWATLVPGRPFDYQFLDENFDNQYAAEARFSTLFFYFAGLAIIISCLGLLGLAAYSTVQRTREIGIRKVLGASVTNITALLSKEFVILVVIAIAIASPVAWYAMGKWVNGFAYQAPISWWVFAVAGVTAIVIALLTVSFHSIKAAVVNPVKSLRTE